MQTALKPKHRRNRRAGGPKLPSLKRREMKAPGCIRADEAYSFLELFQRFGIGSRWLGNARLGGLKTVRIGRQMGVRGAALLEYLASQEK